MTQVRLLELVHGVLVSQRANVCKRMQHWLFTVLYFLKYWKVQTMRVFAQTVTYLSVLSA